MKNFLAAVNAKFAGSSLATDVSSRIYFDNAPDGTAYPYVVWHIVDAAQMDTFTDKIDEITIQFSLYSASRSASEIGTMYDDLTSLFDDTTFSITGDTLVQCQRENLTTIYDPEVVSTSGTTGIRVWTVDYTMVVKD